MDIINLIERFKRFGGSISCFTGAIFTIYRGNNSPNPADSAFIVPLMCTFAALALSATGLTLALRADPKTE